jgi:hypothetical protein
MPRRGYTTQPWVEPGVSTPGGNRPSRTAPCKSARPNTVRTCIYQRLSCNHLSPFQGESLEGIVPQG